MLTDSPRYVLADPLIIGPRLMPAVRLEDATISIEATAVENGTRPHFRFHIDLTNGATYSSGPSDITVMASDWSEAATEALSSLCDYLGMIADDSEILADLPEQIRDWCIDHTDDLTMVYMDLEERA